MNKNVEERRQRPRVQGGWSKPPSSLQKYDRQKSQKYSKRCVQLEKAESSHLNPIKDEKSERSKDRKDTEDPGEHTSNQSPEMIPNPKPSDGASMYNEERRGLWSTGSQVACRQDTLMLKGSKLPQNLSGERARFTFQQPSRQAAGSLSTWKPVMPRNFSWVVENKVCAMGFPGEPGNMQYLHDNNVVYLISLTEERQPDVQHFPQITLIPVKVVDFTPPSLEQIDQCLDIIERANKEGKAVGVHCRLGKGRTGVIVACVYMKTFHLNPTEAISKTKLTRRGSLPTLKLENAVRDFYEHSCNS